MAAAEAHDDQQRGSTDRRYRDDVPAERNSPTPVCYRHSDRQTRLRCTECDRPICYQCSVDAAVGQKCPRCAAPTGRHRTVTARQAFGAPRARVTVAILVITTVVSLPFLMRSQFGFDIADSLAQINVVVEDGELWRLLTAALLHANFTHILFNMWALWVFGPQLEQRYGAVPFLSLYIASALAGGAAFFLLEPAGLAVGASGAIFGLFGAWFHAGYSSRHTPAGRNLFNQLVFLLAINAALPLFIGNIAWQAHAGGFGAGFLIAAVWTRWADGTDNPTVSRTLTAAGVAVAAVLVVVVG